MPAPRCERDPRNEPTYWFAVLEMARERGDWDGADEATRQLIRLGIKVRYIRHRRKEAAPCRRSPSA
jgi:hypothetical protein